MQGVASHLRSRDAYNLLLGLIESHASRVIADSLLYHPANSDLMSQLRNRLRALSGEGVSFDVVMGVGHRDSIHVSVVLVSPLPSVVLSFEARE